MESPAYICRIFRYSFNEKKRISLPFFPLFATLAVTKGMDWNLEVASTRKWRAASLLIVMREKADLLP